MVNAAGTRSLGLAPDVDRLLAKIDKNGPIARPELGPCWVWQASVRKDGYGQFWYRKMNGTAHRGSYELFVGPIPDGLQVLHRCDVRLCIRPEHLFLGTHEDNMADMVAKGRSATKTHCKYGHAFNDANTIMRGKKRVCRACRDRNNAYWNSRRKAS